jgi:hypothetical protein
MVTTTWQKLRHVPADPRITSALFRSGHQLPAQQGIFRGIMQRELQGSPGAAFRHETQFIMVRNVPETAPT